MRDEGLHCVFFEDSPSCAGFFSLLVPLLTRQFTELSRFTVVPEGSSPYHNIKKLLTPQGAGVFLVRDEGLHCVFFEDSPSCAGFFSLLVPLLTRQFTELSRFTVVPEGSSPYHNIKKLLTPQGAGVFLVRDEGLEPPRSPART